MLYRKIDKNGYFVEDVILKEIPLLENGDFDPHYISTAPIGLYKPKWNGKEWVEALTQKEIDILKIPQRMQEIKSKLQELDIKTYKYIDGELSSDEYEVYKNEKIALRKEYNELEKMD